MRGKTLILFAVLARSTAAGAQQPAENTGLAGIYAGPAVTVVDHHFILEQTAAGVTTSRNVTRWGLGGAVVAGVNFDLGSRVILGAQGQLDFGGREASTLTPLGRVSISPRWGYGATARLGYAFGHSSWAYVGGGYGGHRYKTQFPAGVVPLDHWNRSFILTAGAEVPVGPGVRARLEFQHLDGTRNAFILALPVKL